MARSTSIRDGVDSIGSCMKHRKGIEQTLGFRVDPQGLGLTRIPNHAVPSMICKHNAALEDNNHRVDGIKDLFC